MLEQYYIVENNGSRTGPIDLVSLVKRVRSGKVLPMTEIYRPDYDDTVTAESLHELKEFFEAAEEDATPLFHDKQDLAVLPILKESFAYLGSNHTVAMTSAGFVLMGMILTLLVSNILPNLLTALIGTCISGVCYFLNAVFVLRKVRGQGIDSKFMVELMNYHFKPFLFAASITSLIAFGLPALIGATIYSGGYLIMILSMIVYTFFIFTPYFLLDHPELSVKDGIMKSVSWVKAQGGDGIGALVGLLFINVLGAALFIPFFITLPVTSIALADIYEKHISQ
ncbi:MAG: hypothetical protein MRY32_08725 [Rickettsiales bacterium]|nr:hypothetical protein [Rickettsiales bacterium]